jgi:hypothetical protein
MCRKCRVLHGDAAVAHPADPMRALQSHQAQVMPASTVLMPACCAATSAWSPNLPPTCRLPAISYFLEVRSNPEKLQLGVNAYI